VYDWEAHTSSLCSAMYEPEPLPPVVGMPSAKTSTWPGVEQTPT